MPRIDDLIDRVGDAKFITTLNLSRGYWQVPVRSEDQDETAFTTPYGLFQFTVMPFGLQGAPATFQCMMDLILNGVGDFSAAYLDDVVIHSKTWTEHIHHVSLVLQRLRDAGLTLKPKKCQFAMSKCAYLGHVVGNGEIRPEKAKIQAVEEFPVPKTKSQVRAFLGLTGYYRKFILNLQRHSRTSRAKTPRIESNGLPSARSHSSPYNTLCVPLLFYGAPTSPAHLFYKRTLQIEVSERFSARGTRIVRIAPWHITAGNCFRATSATRP